MVEAGRNTGREYLRNAINIAALMLATYVDSAVERGDDRDELLDTANDGLTESGLTLIPADDDDEPPSEAERKAAWFDKFVDSIRMLGDMWKPDDVPDTLAAAARQPVLKDPATLARHIDRAIEFLTKLKAAADA
jgi:hypothetical protein